MEPLVGGRLGVGGTGAPQREHMFARRERARGERDPCTSGASLIKVGAAAGKHAFAQRDFDRDAGRVVAVKSADVDLQHDRVADCDTIGARHQRECVVRGAVPRKDPHRHAIEQVGRKVARVLQLAVGEHFHRPVGRRHGHQRRAQERAAEAWKRISRLGATIAEQCHLSDGGSSVAGRGPLPSSGLHRERAVEQHQWRQPFGWRGTRDIEDEEQEQRPRECAGEERNAGPGTGALKMEIGNCREREPEQCCQQNQHAPELRPHRRGGFRSGSPPVPRVRAGRSLAPATHPAAAAGSRARPRTRPASTFRPARHCRAPPGANPWRHR